MSRSDPPPGPESSPATPLAERVARARARLARLDRERAHAARELAALRAELDAAGRAPDPPDHLPTASATRSAADKVAIFRSLFVGREDVFARRWHNPRTDRSGYSPACRQEWVHGVCEKPRVKCGACPSQAFLRVTDQVVLDHLRGRHVVGLYPMREDESCHFLAVDFDGEGWQDDVAAFVESCGHFDLPVAVERSRSGNGGHVWFFLSGPVSAAIARRMGCFLLTETMGRRSELPLASYDRLFPNQDTLPRGGFGNLIALPLQREARLRGNTEFLDRSFRPLADQWGFLEAAPRIDPERVHAVAREARGSGVLVGAARAVVGKPGERPSGPAGSRAVFESAATPLPAVVEAVLGARLLVAKAGVPARLLGELRQLAVFQNPKFFERQAMRLSTARTPRVIDGSEDLPEHLALPRGCLDRMRSLLEGTGVELKIHDERSNGGDLAVHFQGEARARQRQMAQALLEHDSGVLVAPPGFGKTVLGVQVIAERARTTLVLVHRSALLDQWRSQLALFLGLELEEVGQVGGGKSRRNGHLDVAMLQSLVRSDEPDDVLADYGHVVVDECHHVPARSFEKVLGRAGARYFTGLTATPRRRDGLEPILHQQLGPVRDQLDPKAPAMFTGFARRVVVHETGFALADGEELGIQALYRRLASDEPRNQRIFDDVLHALEAGRSPVLLTERRDHLELFAERLSRFARHVVVLRGGMGSRQRREVAERLQGIPEGEERLLLATGRFLGEGFDDARLDTLFLALPVSWRGTLVQYAGRLHRVHHGKAEVRIHDYVDRAVPMLERMFGRRRRGYSAMGYSVGEAADAGEPGAEPLVEFDADGS